MSPPVTSLAAARRPSRRRQHRWPLPGKWLEQLAGVERSTTVATDVASGLNVGPLTVGLSVQNLGRGMEVGTVNVPLPDRVTLGAALSSPMPVGPFDMLAAVAVGRDTYGELFGGGGVEVSYWPVSGRTFSLRVGEHVRGGDAASRLTLGGGFTGDRIGVDYGFESHGDRGDVHRIGVRWR
jgi:hypothetical protein